MSDLLPTLLLAAVCWGFRILFIVVVPAHRLPATVTRALGFLAPSVLAALVAVETQSAARAGSPVVGAYVVATVALMALVARRTGSMLWTIAIGSAAVVLLDMVLLG
jgi:branched-subunit amino acid transport protein